MTFFIPTGSNQAFDTCDILFAISSGPAACNVTFANGVTIRVGASVEDFTNEVNALYPPALPLMIGPGPTSDGRTGALAARKVQRIQPRNGYPLESLCTMDALGFGFYIPFDVPSVAGFLNATSECGGGGGGPSSPYVDGQPFNLTVTQLDAGTASQNGPTNYLRVGPPGSTVAAIGDAVWWNTRVFVSGITPGASLSLVVQAPFPVPNVGTCCATNVRVIAGNNGDWTQGLLINRNDSNSYYVEGGPATALTTLMIDLAFTQTADGV